MPPTVDVKSIDIKVVLPSTEDVDQLLSNFAVIATRILVEHVPALAKFSGITTDNIKQRCLDVYRFDD